ncbi:MAG: hypothetical protein BJ554DRAFT_4160 [Olpidium bornovanus]|uniref:Uncharacterized protein n=1 Tax=Olpidium bornovanus TaxID=278681 RepID=A0A8H8DFA3_9FUNG|nr:MAG: hypothetical protein BJ554DRAFT_4160 [Olpidium bornovanus]
MTFFLGIKRKKKRKKNKKKSGFTGRFHLAAPVLLFDRLVRGGVGGPPGVLVSAAAGEGVAVLGGGAAVAVRAGPAVGAGRRPVLGGASGGGGRAGGAGRVARGGGAGIARAGLRRSGPVGLRGATLPALGRPVRAGPLRRRRRFRPRRLGPVRRRRRRSRGPPDLRHVRDRHTGRESQSRRVGSVCLEKKTAWNRGGGEDRGRIRGENGQSLGKRELTTGCFRPFLFF